MVDIELLDLVLYKIEHDCDVSLNDMAVGEIYTMIELMREVLVNEAAKVNQS
ncbi:hypothetical protein S144_59 [Shewanella sp. phage 1/44]|uniref:hypothetical protein n=1 Tax=Shewanella sp. phage 1/44 TaxID=1458862 RepID=UPI0004F735D4|nr:hypothetical protein S144_59 [Shewanella sp. phage 1/44]AHK11773.1 hypothetical protein S144_59 [Shewanella sp. phage 1/44]